MLSSGPSYIQGDRRTPAHDERTALMVVSIPTHVDTCAFRKQLLALVEHFAAVGVQATPLELQESTFVEPSEHCALVGTFPGGGFCWSASTLVLQWSERVDCRIDARAGEVSEAQASGDNCDSATRPSALVNLLTLLFGGSVTEHSCFIYVNYSCFLEENRISAADCRQNSKMPMDDVTSFVQPWLIERPWDAPVQQFRHCLQVGNGVSVRVSGLYFGVFRERAAVMTWLHPLLTDTTSPLGISAQWKGSTEGTEAPLSTTVHDVAVPVDFSCRWTCALLSTRVVLRMEDTVCPRLFEIGHSALRETKACNDAQVLTLQVTMGELSGATEHRLETRRIISSSSILTCAVELAYLSPLRSDQSIVGCNTKVLTKQSQPAAPCDLVITRKSQAPFEEERDVLKRYIVENRPDVATMMVNLQRIYDQWQRWHAQLPNVQVYYAVKSNNDLMILQTLAALGAAFDCASEAEIELVRTSLEVPSSRIVYSNPCKQEYGLHCARRHRILLTVFDNHDELYKMKRFYPDAELLLRIKTDDTGSQCPLSCKFGASSDTWEALLDTAKDLGLCVRGIHFHVGSGCSRLGAFREALQDARYVVDLGKLRGFDMSIINIGGGFPGTLQSEAECGKVTFELLCEEIRGAMKEFFPPTLFSHVKFMAEPGRYFASSACSLAVKVYARRRVLGHPSIYYVNDGIYGSFNSIFFDHATPTPEVLVTQQEQSSRSRCVIYGQTCDGLDRITDDVLLPDLQIGDWLFFSHMGAYTLASATTFNGFALPSRLYTRIRVDDDYDGLSQCGTSSTVLVDRQRRNKKAESPSRMAYQEYFSRQNRIVASAAAYARNVRPRYTPTTGITARKPPSALQPQCHKPDLDELTSSQQSEAAPPLLTPVKGPGIRPRATSRPVAVRPLHSTVGHQITTSFRVGTVKPNRRLLATMLRCAYSNCATPVSSQKLSECSNVSSKLHVAA